MHNSTLHTSEATAPAASSHAPSAPHTLDDRTRAELARVAAYAALRIVPDEEIAEMLRRAALGGVR